MLKWICPTDWTHWYLEYFHRGNVDFLVVLWFKCLDCGWKTEQRKPTQTWPIAMDNGFFNDSTVCAIWWFIMLFCLIWWGWWAGIDLVLVFFSRLRIKHFHSDLTMFSFTECAECSPRVVDLENSFFSPYIIAIACCYFPFVAMATLLNQINNTKHSQVLQSFFKSFFFICPTFVHK